MRASTRHFATAVLVLLVLAVAGLGFAWSGLYNIGADDHHTRPVYALLQMLRRNSIHARSQALQPPNLDDPRLILEGAGQYAAMCTGCHLAPGMHDSELRPGLYPQPPILSQERIDPREGFWVIKHGIKMSAMPAWGASHDDPTIWSMVAFLRKLPDLTPAQYRDLVARAPPDDDMDVQMHEHAQAGGDRNAAAAHLAGDTTQAHPDASVPAAQSGASSQR